MLELPIAGFTFINEATVWAGNDFTDANAYTYVLNEWQIAELSNASASLAARKIPAHELRRDDFPLVHTAPLIDQVYSDLEDGRGFALLRDWPSTQKSYRENVAAFRGITTHLGSIVVQNYEGQPIVDFKDKGVGINMSPSDAQLY